MWRLPNPAAIPGAEAATCPIIIRVTTMAEVPVITTATAIHAIIPTATATAIAAGATAIIHRQASRRRQGVTLLHPAAARRLPAAAVAVLPALQQDRRGNTG